MTSGNIFGVMRSKQLNMADAILYLKGDSVSKQYEITEGFASAFSDSILLAIRELFYWQRRHANATSFTSMLFTLISKADCFNRKKLKIAFPSEVIAWEMWQSAQDEREFFKQFDLIS
jgi:hypothetical protein